MCVDTILSELDFTITDDDEAVESETLAVSDLLGVPVGVAEKAGLLVSVSNADCVCVCANEKLADALAL